MTKIPSLTEIDFHYCSSFSQNDDDCNYIKALCYAIPGLKHLGCITTLNNDAIDAICSLQNLRRLWIRSTVGRHDHAVQISQSLPNLEELYISIRPDQSAEAIWSLAKMPQLKLLKIPLISLSKHVLLFSYPNNFSVLRYLILMMSARDVDQRAQVTTALAKHRPNLNVSWNLY